MGLTFPNLGNSANPDINDATDLSSYASSSWTPPTSGMIVCFASSRATSGTTNEPTMSGNGLTWTKIVSVQRGGANTLTLLAADAAGATPGATTIAFGGQTQHFCRASFFHVEDVDLSGGVAAAFVQTPTNQGDGVTSGDVTLSAASHADNRPIAAFFHSANEATAHRTDWTELDDIAGGFLNTAIETQCRTDAFETTASASWATSTSVVWLGIAAEIKAAGGATPTLTQSAYRFYNDDGDEAGSSAAAAENTPASVGVGETIRLRVQVDASADPFAASLQLEQREAGSSDPWEVIGHGD